MNIAIAVIGPGFPFTATGMTRRDSVLDFESSER